MAKLCQDQSVSHSSVTAAAVSSWSVFVSSVLSDTNFPSPSLCLSNSTTPIKDSKWFEDAQKQICQHLSVFQTLANHSDHRVRNVLLDCVKTLINNCRMTLEPGMKHVLNILIILSVDEYDSINKDAREFLDKFVASWNEDSSFSFNNQVKKSLFDLCNSLGTTLGLYEVEKLERTLSLLKGYLSFICANNHNKSMFHFSQTHLKNLIQSLILVSKFEPKSQKLILATGYRDFSDMDFLFHPEYYLGVKKVEKKFLHLTKPRLVETVKDICKIVGRSNCLYQVTVLLLEAIKELDDTMANEAIFVMNNVIEGYGKLKSSTDCDALKQVLKCYLDIIERKDTEEAIEGIGIVCKVLGEKADIGLVLSHLVTNIKNDNLNIVTILHHALVDIATGLGVTVQDVIKEQVEHLTKDLNLNLRKMNSLNNHGVRMMIRLVMKVSGKDQKMNDLQDTIQSLLDHLAKADEETTIKILDIVQVFVGAMKEKMQSEQEDDVRKKSDIVLKNQGLVTKMILKLEEERKKDEELAEQLLKCPEDGFHEKKECDENEDNMEENNNEVEEKMTIEQKWLEIVIQNTRHFISMQGKPQWQISSINIVSTCLQLLAGTHGQAPGEKQTRVLPLVHLTWQPLKLCFKSSNVFLVDTAFSCLMVIARVARDFVHSRTVSDVFPALLQFLTSLQVMVEDRDKQMTMVASQSRRILARLCSGIWSLLELLDLHPLETDPIIQLVLDHLGRSLTVTGEDQGDMTITGADDNNKTRLKVEDKGPGHNLVPLRNVDKNILWLKLNHAN